MDYKKYKELVACSKQNCIVVDWEFVIGPSDKPYWSPICACSKTYSNLDLLEGIKNKPLSENEKKFRKRIKGIRRLWRVPLVRYILAKKIMKICKNQFDVKHHLILKFQDLDKNEHGSYEHGNTGTVRVNGKDLKNFPLVCRTIAHEVAHARQYQDIDTYRKEEKINDWANYTKKLQNYSKYDPHAPKWHIESLKFVGYKEPFDVYWNSSIESVARDIASEQVSRLRIREVFGSDLLSSF